MMRNDWFPMSSERKSIVFSYYVVGSYLGEENIIACDSLSYALSRCLPGGNGVNYLTDGGHYTIC